MALFTQVKTLPWLFQGEISLASSSQHHSRRDLCGLYIHVLRHISYKSHEFDWVTQATLWYFSESLTTYKLWKKKKKLVPRNQYRNKGKPSRKAVIQ